MSSDDTLFDKRIVQRNVLRGLLTRKDVEKRIEQLPDRAGNCETLRIGEEGRDSRPAEANLAPVASAPAAVSHGTNGSSVQEPTPVSAFYNPPTQV